MDGTDWAKEEEVGAQGPTTHLWEESWDDDDTSDDFSVQLKEELKKMESQRKG
jgi:26 proteasome complex subunit DSS1